METDNNNFFGKHRFIFSPLFGFLICIVWSHFIVVSANNSGGDNGSDPFGIGHFIFLYLTAPILFIVSTKIIYKILKPKILIPEEEIMEASYKKSLRIWYVIALIPFFYILYIIVSSTIYSAKYESEIFIGRTLMSARQDAYMFGVHKTTNFSGYCSTEAGYLKNVDIKYTCNDSKDSFAFNLYDPKLKVTWCVDNLHGNEFGIVQKIDPGVQCDSSFSTSSPKIN